MSAFVYRGRSLNGDPVTGSLEGDTPDGVAARLSELGITPVSIERSEERRSARESLQRLFGREKATPDDLLLFSRQMHALVKSGVPIVRGLTGLAESSRSAVMRSALEDITESLASGQDLAGAMARHPEVFSRLYVALVRVGENAGTLEESFLHMHEHLDRERRTRSELKAAMRYPVIVVIAIAVAMAILTLFVLPRFAHLYAQFHAQLPWATRLIFAVSNFVGHFWWLVLGLLVAAGWGFFAWIRTERGRYRWDRTKLRTPVIGGILFRSALARFARTFSIIQRTGVPLTQGVSLVADSVDNSYLGTRLLEIRNGIERGASLTATAAATGLFPSLILQMLGVGEETGALDDMLGEVADFYQREVDYDLSRLSSLIEPIMIAGVAAMVLVLALGVYLPMWDLYRLIQH